MDRSLMQNSPTECGVLECDRKGSIKCRPWPTRGCCAMGKKYCEIFNWLPYRKSQRKNTIVDMCLKPHGVKTSKTCGWMKLYCRDNCMSKQTLD